MDLAGGAFVVACGVVLFGAVVRGFTGFGASLIWISGLSFVMDPDEAVPIIFCLEVIVSAQLLPACRHDVEWPTLRHLVVGVIVGMPIGAVVLIVFEPEPMRVVVAGVVLLSVVALATGRSLPLGTGRGGIVGTGVVSGVLNGAAAAGGPPVIVHFMGSRGGMVVSRASLIAFFGITDIIGIAIVAATGLLDGAALVRAAALAPIMLVGAAIGARGFGSADEQTVRRSALVVLTVLGILMLVRNL
ncbi:MAG: membrane protein [Acidimicrobiales bacterium]|nr:MAG: membrane protein [Acidimicrobiales bacterium]